MLHARKNDSHQGEARVVTPKKDRHFGEHVARCTSKNAKDKSNSATLRASQGATQRDLLGMENMSSRMSHYDSEKDSGYSEAGSDSLQNDTDEQFSSVSSHQRESNSVCDKNSGSAPGCSMAPYEELTPIYVIKNLLVKPSRPEQRLHSPLAWGRGWHSLTGSKAPAQLVLIQQPAIPAPTSSSPAVSTSVAGQRKKGVSRSNKNHSSKSSYLPILNSYPRIAPHPRKDGHDKGKDVSAVGACKLSGGEGHSLSKRVCTEEEKMEAVSTTSHRVTPRRQLQNQREATQPQFKNRSNHSSSHKPPQHPLTAASPASSTTQHKTHHRHHNSHSDSVCSPSVTSSQSHTPSPPAFLDSPPSSSPSSTSSVSHRPYRPAPDAAAAGGLSDSQSDCSSVRQRRFHNTADILNQSGLLAITLSTKELLKQNAATERDIAQLHQHARLLCQIAQAGQQGFSDSSNTLNKLLQAMSQSGSYPNLDANKFKVLCDSHPQAEKGDEGDEKWERGRKADNGAPQPLVSLNNFCEGISPPSPLFAQSPEVSLLQETEAADSMCCHTADPPARPMPDQGCRQAAEAGLDKVLSYRSYYDTREQFPQ